MVWGYALGWFLVTDPLKLLAYRVLASTAKVAPKRQDEDKAVDAAKNAKTKSGVETGRQVDVKPSEPKPEAKAAASPASKSEPQPAPKVAAKPAEGAKPAEAKPEARAEPPSDAKPDEAKPEGKVEASPASKPEPQPAPKAGTKPAEAEPKLGSDGKIEGADLLDMKLGDVLLAGIAKDPQGAGRFIAQAIAEIEAAPGPKLPGQANKSQPKSDAAATQESEPAPAPATTPKAAE
jgi:hypothetical protein